MSTISDFNRIEDCDKINSRCIDAFLDVTYDKDNSPETICIKSSWGGECVDLTPLVKAAETCTTLYLSPEDSPKCLVYEPECGDNICINGDDLSKIISMKYLKDVSTDELSDGDVYVYNSTTNLFTPFDLNTALSNINTTIQGLNATINNLLNRVIALEGKLTPPADAPEDVSVMFGNINLYSDPNVTINSQTGLVTSLDKDHGMYSHLLEDEAFGDEIFG